MTEPGPAAPEQMSAVSVRSATTDDIPALFDAIVGLAVYEREPDAVVGTPEMLREALFGADPSAEALIAELDGETVGTAIFYRTFSTWEMTPGIWLEDIYVSPDHRRGGGRTGHGRTGIGEALLRHLAALTIERGYTRLEWTALDWNEPALSFYRKHGAEVMTDWRQHRLDGDALRAVADGRSGQSSTTPRAAAATAQPTSTSAPVAPSSEL